MDDLTTEVMEGNKTIEMFQAMAIISFKMGTLWENCVLYNLSDAIFKNPMQLNYN